MNIKYLAFVFACFVMFFSTPAHATKVVDDNFLVDGTAETDASYFGSNTAGAIEFNTNSIGLVSGSSGRQIHGLFDTQTLANTGDSLRTTISFTTPATVAAGNEDIRVGLFDHLERTAPDQLGQNTSYGSSNPNPLYNGLPGFYLELDIETGVATTDLDIRRSDPSTTGRLISTSGGFGSIGNGPDIGYAIAPNTDYTIVLTVTRTATNTLVIRADFGDATFSASDLAPASFNIGMLAMGSSSGALGSTNVGGEPDNGLDITNFSVEFIAGDPVDGGGSEGVVSTVVDDDFTTDGTAVTDASYFGSSTASAIEINTNSVGLVSGSSSRQIHGLFETQTLATTGDSLKATIVFTTPATVGMTNEDLRIGLFDHLERTGADQLGQNTSYGSSNPNSSYIGLPGFYLELDVEAADPATDLDIRRSDPSTTGRLLATSSGFASIGNGPDVGYAFEVNTQYTVVLTVTRTATSTFDISADFAGATFTATDLAPASFNIGMLAMGSSSGAFGTSNAPGTDANVVNDNGIDINSFNVEVTTFPPGDGGGDGGEGEGSEGGSDVSLVVVDDDFLNDGSTVTDAAYFTSNNLNAIEFNDDSLGLVSGTSGRHIHGLFDTQSLVRVGDLLRATISFTTPPTVSTGADDIRIGLFDHLGRTSDTELGQNTTFNSSNPNPTYAGLPGYYVELDVERFSRQSDLEIGRSTPTVTGRLLNTNGGFARENGPDIGYTILPDTDYTVYLTVERTADGLDVNANFQGRSFTISDPAPLSSNFGMLAINASSAAFGVSNVPGEPDNGIDITNINIEFIRSTVVEDDFVTDGTAVESTDGAYFGSSGADAIEFNDNSIGLVTGDSGRQIHTLFNTQTLASAGDVLEASLTFTTPATVAATDRDIRIGLFDHLDRNTETQLAQNTSFSPASPNPDFAGLPGFYLELDVESADPMTNLEISRSAPSGTGLLLTTSDGFNSLPGGSGPDIGYAIEANTSYTVNFTIERTEDDGLNITTNFLGESLTVTDVTPASFDFGMLAFYASPGAAGSSSVAGEADNGIDITNFSLNVRRFFEPPFVDLPPVELPEGDHPDVEIVPEVPVFPVDPVIPGSDDGDEGVGGGATFRNASSAVPGIISLLLDGEDPIQFTNTQKVAIYFGLNPNLPPWRNFDLSDWALDAPNADPADGLSARTDDEDFGNGELFPGTEPFFFTGSDGAMVFKSIVGGARTSQNTSFARSELREMLRAGDTSIRTRGINGNNWALDHQP